MLSDLLQIGEGFQFMVVPKTWGGHVVNIAIKEEGNVVIGESLYYESVRDAKYYSKIILSKLGAVGGTLLSALGIGASTIMHVFGL